MKVFEQRKLDLIRRAIELVHTCDCEIQMFIYSKSLKNGDEPKGSLTQYSSSDVDLLLANFLDEERVEILTDQEYDKLNALQQSDADATQASEGCRQETVTADVQAVADRAPSTEVQATSNAARKPIMLVAGGGCLSGAKAPPRDVPPRTHTNEHGLPPREMPHAVKRDLHASDNETNLNEVTEDGADQPEAKKAKKKTLKETLKETGLETLKETGLETANDADLDNAAESSTLGNSESWMLMVEEP